MAVYGISIDAWIASHMAVKNLIFTGSNFAALHIFDSDDVLLAEILLDSDASGIDSNGNLILEVFSQETSAPAGGTASYASIYSAAGDIVFSLPCIVSEMLMTGFCVLDSLTIEYGDTVNAQTIVIPSGPKIYG